MKIEEQIKVMQHYANGGEVESIDVYDGNWYRCILPSWNWGVKEYRIKEESNKITIEEWVCQNEYGEYRVFKGDDNYFKDINYSKIKLLSSEDFEL